MRIYPDAKFRNGEYYVGGSKMLLEHSEIPERVRVAMLMLDAATKRSRKDQTYDFPENVIIPGVGEYAYDATDNEKLYWIDKKYKP